MTMAVCTGETSAVTLASGEQQRSSGERSVSTNASSLQSRGIRGSVVVTKTVSGANRQLVTALSLMSSFYSGLKQIDERMSSVASNSFRTAAMMIFFFTLF